MSVSMIATCASIYLPSTLYLFLIPCIMSHSRPYISHRISLLVGPDDPDVATPIFSRTRALLMHFPQMQYARMVVYRWLENG